MSSFDIHELRRNTVLYLYAQKDVIMVDPPYQRQSDVWTQEKKQLLVDSIINSFDIPKMYFREFTPPVPGKDGNGEYRFAVIDGKQRLSSVWGFIDGEFKLSDDFEYLRDSSVQAAGLTYSELASRFPKLKLDFDQTPLPVITIHTDDEELIEEMFSRLNEAVPLNAAEKRNALGGPLPPVIRDLSQHRFFVRKLPFSNSRYRHYDLVAKMLLFEDADRVRDTKKAYLDGLVKDFRKREPTEAQQLKVRVEKVLDRMAQEFVDSDSLLRSVGMVSIYYLLFREENESDWGAMTRMSLQQFEQARDQNRKVAQEDITKAEYTLVEFDRLAQSPNDSVALQFRLGVLRSFLAEHLEGQRNL